GVVGARGDALLGERLGDGLGVLAGCGVDDARALATGGELQRGGELVVGFAERAYIEADGRAVEVADEDIRLDHVEMLDDLVANRAGGSGGEGEDRRVAQLLDEGSEAEVVRAEVVAPITDAVSLVDHEEGRFETLEEREGLVVGELLRREEEEHLVRVLELGEEVVPVALRKCGVQLGGVDAALPLKAVDLVSLEGDERGDDDGDAGADDAGDLVDGGFS